MPDDYLTRIVSTGDPLSEYELGLVGGSDGSDPRSMQLRWRVADQMDLRRISVVLRELANRLEVLSDPRRFDEFGALSGARSARIQAQGKLTRRRKSA